jgi:cytochrome c-type biogenesis protein CcmH
VRRYWRWGPWLALVGLAALLLAVGSHRTSHPTLDAQVMHIANQVRCPVCDGETAAQSSAPASVQIRSEIRQELLAGQTSGQILAGLVRDYGSGILEKPQSSGVGLVVWVAPVVATVLAAAALVFAFVRWRRRAQPAGGVDEGPAAPGGVSVGAPASVSVGAPAPVAASSVLVSASPAGLSAGGRAPNKRVSDERVSDERVSDERVSDERVSDERVSDGLPALVTSPAGASLDEALAAVVAPATAVASVQSSGSSVLPGPDLLPAATSNGGTLEGVVAGPSPNLDSAGPEAGEPPSPSPRRRQPWLRGVVIGVGVCLIAGGAGWAVAESSQTRLPGQTVTGQALGSEAIAQDMQTAQDDAAKGNAVAAIKEYQKILQTDPNQVDALTAEGWLLVQTAQPSLLQQGIQLLAAAEKADPSYAPAHLYRGLAFLGEADYSDAVPEFQWYLAHQPDPSITADVRQDLRQAQAGVARTGSSGAAKS